METALGYEQELESHIKQERAAVKLSSVVGELLYDKGIELVFFRNHLTDVTVAQMLKLHVYSKRVVNKPVDIFTSVELAEEILKMDLAPAKLDIGKLASEWLNCAKLLICVLSAAKGELSRCRPSMRFFQ